MRREERGIERRWYHDPFVLRRAGFLFLRGCEGATR
jgi:hypothetical protein